MASIGYLIRIELKKHLGDSPEESRTCIVLPPPEAKLNYSDAAERAFDLVAEAVHQASRYAVIEETARRRVFVEDLRTLRNTLLLEKDGWRCFSVRI